MVKFVKNFFTKHVGLKIMALVLTLVLWFYVVGELKKGSEEERFFMNRILPSDQIVAKKLSIKPILIGKPRYGYVIEEEKAVIVPEYCIVVGTRDLLGNIKFAYTMPVDVSGSYKTITKSVPLNPIAPGVYMEETLVQITIPIEKSEQ